MIKNIWYSFKVLKMWHSLASVVHGFIQWWVYTKDLLIPKENKISIGCSSMSFPLPRLLLSRHNATVMESCFCSVPLLTFRKHHFVLSFSIFIVHQFISLTWSHCVLAGLASMMNNKGRSGSLWPQTDWETHLETCSLMLSDGFTTESLTWRWIRSGVNLSRRGAGHAFSTG